MAAQGSPAETSEVMAKPQQIASITALPLSPTDDRRARMVKYLIAMGVRLVCIAMCFVVQGWWLAVFAVAAIVLPYFAVILANVGNEPGGRVERPGSIVPVRSSGNRPFEPSDASE